MAKKLSNYVQDIRLHKNFLEELRFMRLLRKYHGDGVVAVLRLWTWVATYMPTDGRLEEITARDIVLICWPTAPETFVDDLIRDGFLAQDEDGVLSLPYWAEEQPYVAQAEERSEAARVKAEKRWGGRSPKDGEPQKCRGNAKAKPQKCSNTNSNTNLKSPPAPPRGGRAQDAPVSEIVQLYREVLPELPEPLEETEKLVKDIATRWKAKPERQSLKWWRWFFGLVRQCPHLMGEGKGDWRASLGWLVTKGCMDKVLAGEYLPPPESAPPQARGLSQEEFEALVREHERRENEATPG